MSIKHQTTTVTGELLKGLVKNLMSVWNITIDCYLKYVERGYISKAEIAKVIEEIRLLHLWSEEMSH